MRARALVVCCVVVQAVASAAAGSTVSITVANESGLPRYEVARVSVPLARGVLKGEPPARVTVGERQVAGQARAITAWPDGSARRVMLSFPVRLQSDQAIACAYGPAAPPRPAERPPLLQRDGTVVRVRADAFQLVVQDDGVLLLGNAGGEPLAAVRAFGPRLADPQAATTEVIESGPWFAWLRWRQDGSDYCREVDVQADRLGHIRLTQRVLRHLRGNDWTPDFGFELSAPKAKALRLPSKPVHCLGLDPDSAFASHPELVASLKLADGTDVSLANPLALRQRRGTLAAETSADGAVAVRVSRLEPVADAKNRLMLQEGMWRVAEMLIQPGGADTLAAAIDLPLMPRAAWQAYDAVYHTGPPLRVEHPVLKRLVERYVYDLTRMSINGDDWGNMTRYSPHSDTAPINSMVRYNHCAYVWADVFRTGDPRLRRVAIDWSENYRNFSVYWGPQKHFYGGSKRGRKNRNLPGSPHGPGTYMVRFNNAVGFCTKGYHSFWLAYEETGDPRFKEAAEAQAKWSATHVHCHKGEMRNVGMVADYAKLYGYTGNRFYLDNAVRLWEEFKSKQQPDLMFTQGGKPPTGNQLYILNDAHGYRHPFYKAYITQYATNALPHLLEHRPDDKRLRDTILACNAWMASVQTAGGGWGYPGPTSAGASWWIEYCHGLMLACRIEPRKATLDAVARDLRAIVAGFEKCGAIPSGILRWERVQGVKITPELYHLGTDRDRSKDFSHGRLCFGASPDSTVYFQVVLRDYLAHRPEASLFARDKVLQQILRLPVSLSPSSQWSADTSPWLRIACAHRVVPEGMHVRLAAKAKGRLASRAPDFQWEFSDGTVASGPVIERTFAQRGRQLVKLIARGRGEHVQKVDFTTPTGPGDLGLKRWPKGLRVQAEAPSGQGGCDKPVQIWRDRMGADGAAFSHWDRKGHWLEWAFRVPRDGHYHLLVKYACPADARRTVSLDGKPLGELALPASGGYTLRDRDDYAVELLRQPDGKPRRLHLAAGAHTVRMTNTDGKGCNFDYLELLPTASNQ